MLNIFIFLGPVKKRYKLYEVDSNIPVPKRTLFWKAARSGLNDSFVSSGHDEDIASENFSLTVEDCDDDDSLKDMFIDDGSDDEEDDTCSLIDEDGKHYTDAASDLSCYSQDSNISDNFWVGESTDDEDWGTWDTNSSSDENGGSCNDESDQNEKNPQNSEKSSTALEEFCVLAYARRFNLSGEATRYLIKLISVLSPEFGIGHGSLQSDENSNCKCVHYCEKCNAIFPEDQNVVVCGTAGCGGKRYKGNTAAQKQPNRQPKCSYVIANMEFQLKLILERSNNWELIQEMKRRYVGEISTDGCIRDIMDGKLYKRLCEPGQFLSHNTHISGLMNTDGIPLYSSSKVKLWPIFLAINELPPSPRFSRNNIVLAGIWQGKDNPPFIHYMYSFALAVEKLYYEGFSITLPDQSVVIVKFGVICASVDLQAKAYIANMSMHNGEYGCTTCEEPGKVVKKGKGHVRCYPYHETLDKPQIRKSDDINKAAQKATRQNRVKGICGVSGLSALPDFDLVYGLVPDYMHGVLLGTTKSLMQLWFSPKNSAKPFFIGNYLDEISSRIQKMTPPDCIERLPRNLEKHYVNYKATEFQTWLLYYAVPCLRHILPDVYLEHFCSFSESVFLLLGDNITRADIHRASDLLNKFYKAYQNLYGIECCTLNLHNVGAHLVSFVDNWGPLWAWSCFPFEDANAAILQAVNGTGDVTRQYIHTKQLEMKLNALDITTCTGNDREKSFLNEIRKRGRCWTSTKPMQNCNVAGKLLKLSENLAPNNLLLSINAEKLSEVRKCVRIELCGQKFYSEEYSRMKKRVCYFVVSKAGDIFAIKYYVINRVKEVFAVAKKYELEHNCFFFESSGRHILRIKEGDENNLHVFSASLIKEKVFFITVGEMKCISLLPNVIGHSVLK